MLPTSDTSTNQNEAAHNNRPPDKSMHTTTSSIKSIEELTTTTRLEDQSNSKDPDRTLNSTKSAFNTLSPKHQQQKNSPKVKTSGQKNGLEKETKLLQNSSSLKSKESNALAHPASSKKTKCAKCCVIV